MHILSCAAYRINLELCRCECFNLYEQQVPYGQAWAWQKSIVNEKKTLIQRNEDCSDSLFVLQHRPVYTLGTASSEQFLNFDVKDSPFDIYRTERGGEVTYHGPGQVLCQWMNTSFELFMFVLGGEE